ncbi:MAG: hypothetical protein H6677_13480 [Candidatus Obscuribacterales bacterium]|nr:hypothetical protein [Candidatus Obscuribacterales bacterium]
MKEKVRAGAKPILMKRGRSEKGASIALAAAFFFVCVLLIYFGFNMSVLMGGSRQVRNAVDAAVLNVAKRQIETKIKSSNAFADVADSTGNIGISNINRVWGKALLVNANAEEIQKAGLAKGSTMGNAATSYQMAKQLNDDLVEKLTDPIRLNMYFRHTSNKRGAPLLGESSKLDKAKDTQYQIAMVGRGDESNIKYKADQFPAGTSVCGLKFNGQTYLQGYQSLMMNGKPFMFTTFHAAEMPHLISDTVFQQSKPTVTPVGDFSNPIPNAWHASGVVYGEKGNLRASASAVANPQRQFDLAIPYGYVKIAMTNESKWYIEGKFKKRIFYKSEPGQKVLGLPMGKLSDDKQFDGWANLGNEYNQPSLLAYMDITGGDKEAVYDRMTQRLKQVDPKFSKQKLKKLLDKVSLTSGASEYYIYPVYKSADNTDPSLTVGPDTGSLPGWLKKAAELDGGNTTIVQEKALFGEPNTAYPVPIDNPPPTCGTKFTGTIDWAPCTGFNQCLGLVKLARETRINFVPTGGNPFSGI